MLLIRSSVTPALGSVLFGFYAPPVVCLSGLVSLGLGPMYLGLYLCLSVLYLLGMCFCSLSDLVSLGLGLSMLSGLVVSVGSFVALGSCAWGLLNIRVLGYVFWYFGVLGLWYLISCFFELLFYFLIPVCSSSC